MNKLHVVVRRVHSRKGARRLSSLPNLSTTEPINLWWKREDPPSIHDRINFRWQKGEGPTVTIQRRPSKKAGPPEPLSAGDWKRIASSCLSRLTCSFPSITTKENFGRKLGESYPVVIEYSSPNIAKPLHMGHLRSTITGKCVTNLASFAGHDTTSLCLLGDWGTQFGVLHTGVINKFKEHNNTPSSVTFPDFVRSLSLHELLAIYVESSKNESAEFRNNALKYSALLEEEFEKRITSDSTALWEHTRNITLDHLKQCYEKIGISFDSFEGESEYCRGSVHTSYALEALERRGLVCKQPDGSVRVRVSDDSTAVILKKDNSTVYLLRDIACALKRIEAYGASSHHVYVVDIGQSDHFRNLFRVLQGLGVSASCEQGSEQLPFSSKHSHVYFGKVSGMSSRAGKYVLLSDVISDGATLMHDERKKSKNARNTDDFSVSETLAVSGLVVNALKVRRGKEYSFDWMEALKGSGNSGVSLQYAVARLRSLEQRVGGSALTGNLSIHDLVGVIVDQSGSVEVNQLVACLLNFEDSFWRSYLTVEPCVLVSYAFMLSDRVSKALSVTSVINEKNEQLAASYAFLFHTSRIVMETCLKIIGVPVLDKGF